MVEGIGGPYVTLACFCEEKLEEASGLMSLIRIIDRIIIQVGQGAPEQMPPINVGTKLIVKLYSGEARGTFNLKLELMAPSGTHVQQTGFSLLFEGDDRPIQATINLAFQAEEHGLYWVNLYFEEQLLTRVPLRLVWQRTGM